MVDVSVFTGGAGRRAEGILALAVGSGDVMRGAFSVRAELVDAPSHDWREQSRRRAPGRGFAGDEVGAEAAGTEGRLDRALRGCEGLQ
jgi:hypothetical protein